MTYILPLISSIVGIGLGILSCLIFIQMDKTWQKATFTGGSQLGSLFIAFKQFHNIRQYITVSDMTLAITILFYLLFYMLAIFISAWLFIRHIKENEDRDFNIRTSDILFGNIEALDLNIKSRIQQIERKYNLEELKQKKSDLDSREDIVVEKEQELRKLELDIKNQRFQNIFLPIPNNKHYPICNESIENFTHYADLLWDFSRKFNNLTCGFIQRSKSQSSTEQENAIFLGYLQGISSYILSNLLDSHSARIHFRYYNKKKKSFVQLFSSLEPESEADTLKDIPQNKNSLINLSARLNRSLIMSLNPEDSYDSVSQHTEHWEDYMTMTFKSFRNEKNIPLISMGISVKKKSKHIEQMVFLNAIKVEDLIENYLLELNKYINIKKILENWEDSSECG